MPYTPHNYITLYFCVTCTACGQSSDTVIRQISTVTVHTICRDGATDCFWLVPTSICTYLQCWYCLLHILCNKTHDDDADDDDDDCVRVHCSGGCFCTKHKKGDDEDEHLVNTRSNVNTGYDPSTSALSLASFHVATILWRTNSTSESVQTGRWKRWYSSYYVTTCSRDGVGSRIWVLRRAAWWQ